MVKFSEHDHVNYPKVRDVLEDFVNNADAVIKARIYSQIGRTSRLLYTLFTYILSLRLTRAGSDSLMPTQLTNEYKGLIP